MTRIVLAFALLALLASAADPTPSTVSLTSGSFAAAPGSKVIDATTTTAADYASWYLYDTATFGPGAANTTLYAYGFDYSGTALTKVISRALNATLLSNGTAATAVTDAKIGTDGVWAAGLTLTSSPKWGVGLGSVGIAYVAADTATVPCRQVYLAVLNGAGSSPIVTKQVTSNVCTKCVSVTASTGTGYAISIGNVYYDNATYWVSYTQNLYTETETVTTSQTTCADAPTATGVSGRVIALTSVKSNLNGVAATSTGTLAYTAATELFSGTAALTADPQCGPSNYTNSTNIYCVYKDAATNKNLVLQPVTMSSGAKGTSVTLATDATTGTTGNADNVVKVFTFAGFVASQYQQGVLINNNTGTGATLAYTNNLNFYNTTSGAATQTAGGAIVGSTYTTSIQSGVFSGAGIPWGSGYAIVDGYLSSTTTTPSTYTYEYGSFLSNSTVNVSKTTIGTVQGANLASYFVDANGAFWFGAVTLDTTAGGVTSASIGKLVDQLYSAGNILASFFALISLMIAALFAF